MDQITVSYSALRDWKTCRQLYYNRRVKNIKPKTTPKPLKMGSLLHACLEAYYKGEENWADPILAEEYEFRKMTEEEQEYYGDMTGDALRIMNAYVKKYEESDLETIAVEVSFGDKETDMFPPVEIAPGIFLKGRIDWICRDHRGVWIAEHKSCFGKIPTDDTRLFDLQTAIYVKVAMKLAPELGFKAEEIVGVMFDYLKTKPAKVPEVLKSKKGISRAKKIKTDYDTFMKAILDNGFDPADYTAELERASKIPFFHRKFLSKPQKLTKQLLRETEIVAKEISKLKNFPYKNLRRECSMCSYYALCTAELMDLDVEFLLKTEYFIDEKVEMEGGEFDAEEEKDFDNGED